MTKTKKLSRRKLIKKYVIPELNQDACITKVQSKGKIGVGLIEKSYSNSGKLGIIPLRLIRDLVNMGLLTEYQTHIREDTIFIHYDYIYGHRCPWRCECGKQCGGIKSHVKENLAHQCSIHFDTYGSTDTYCSHSLDHKHQYEDTGCTESLIDEKTVKTIKVPTCKYCHYSMPYNEIIKNPQFIVEAPA